MDIARKNMLLYAGVAAIVIIGVGYFLFHGTLTTSSLYNTSVSSSELSTLSSIANNQSLAASVGTTAYAGVNPSTYIAQINQTPLVSNGKPEVLFVGADFCPYCAATRWAMVIALMRFGNLSNIKYGESSPTDVYPNTPTFSFLNYTYTSSYITFTAFETETRTDQPLETLPTNVSNIFTKYGNGIPFIDFNNKYAESGSVINPGLYQGLSWARITAELPQSSTQMSQAVIGSANIYTAEICSMINGTAPVCAQNYVKQAEGRFVPS